MKKTISFLLCLFTLSTQAQLHNRLIKFNVGYSRAQLGFEQNIQAFNDTSSHQFEFTTQLPTFSYSHEFIISDILSISGKGGFQYLNVFYDHQHYGSPFVFLSVNPALSLFYREKFEYYMKLQVGVTYWMNKPELLDDLTRRIFPEKISAITGVTLVGLNYYFTPKLGANFELSIWSPELITFGLSYRFFRGELPTIQELQEL